MKPIKPPPVKKRKRAASVGTDQATKRAKHVTTTPTPVVTAGPVVPRLIASNGKGPKAVSDAVFNKPHKITYQPLDDAATAVRADRKSKRKSEKLGEEGAVAYLQEHTGYTDIELHEATPANPHTLPTTPRRRWSHGVAFNGAHVADITYWDGFQLHVIEAKGGGSQLGQRKQSRFHQDTSGTDLMNAAPANVRNNTGAMKNLSNAVQGKNFKAGDSRPNAVKQYLPRTLGQGTQPYLTDIAHTMAASTKGDGRALVGQAILAQGNTVHYQPVSTQAPLDGGDVDVHTMNTQ